MGFFTKKKPVQQPKANSFGDDLNKLDANGELPFGWASHNNDFTDKLSEMEMHVVGMYSDAKTEQDKKDAILSLIKFLEDAETYSAKCGECQLKYFKWMYTENPDFMKMVNKRISELNKIVG